MNMLLFEDALDIVLAQAFCVGTEHVDLPGSLGRILACDIFSDIDMPPFNKSAVDGFACRMTDLPFNSFGTADSRPFSIVETIAAGATPTVSLSQGTCSKIMTGAMIPPGADCVVMVEDSGMVGSDQVQFTRVTDSKNICYRSEDIKQGELVLHKGTRITPAHVAVLAAVGVSLPLVAKLPKVGIISTGDELVEPGTVPGSGQIRNSNAWQLLAQVQSVPARPFYYGIAPDEEGALKEMIERATGSNDVVLLTGGVSMGDFDFVPAVMQETGIEILFKSIAIQPGRPTVFGRKNNTFIFGLPGNPVSAFVLFEVMVKPFIHHLMGSRPETFAFSLPMGVGFSRRKSIRKSMIPVIIRNGEVFPLEYHGSAHINAYSMANGIMELQIGITQVQKGDIVYVRPL